METHGHPQFSFVFGSWKDEKNLSLNVLYFHTKFCSIGCFPYGGLWSFLKKLRIRGVYKPASRKKREKTTDPLVNPYKDIYIFLLDLEKIGLRMSIKKPYAHVERC